MKYFIIAVLICIAGSCKKDNNGDNEGSGGDSEHYVRFKVNGTQLEYKSAALSQMIPLTSDQLYSCVLQGYQDSSVANKNLLGIIIWSEAPVTTTTYRNADQAEKLNGTTVPQVLLTYYDTDKNGYLSMGVPAARVPPLDKIISDVQVTITELTSDRIAGTFSGTVYKSTDSDFAVTVKIEDGKFNLRKY